MGMKVKPFGAFNAGSNNPADSEATNRIVIPPNILYEPRR